MYERATPFAAGDTVNRVKMLSKDRDRMSSAPRMSTRKPSHRYFKV